MDTDVWGWTYAYKTNEYGTWKNAYFKTQENKMKRMGLLAGKYSGRTG